MSGASGPMVTVQIAVGPLRHRVRLAVSSPLAVTCVAFGARYRSVTVRSAPTSGETTAGPRPPRPGSWRRGRRTRRRLRQRRGGHRS